MAAPDSSDTEAMKAFQAQGGTIVVGLSKGEWENVKRAGAVLPAGQICPTAKPYSSDPAAKPVDLVPEEMCGTRNLRALGYTHAVDVDGQNHANFRSRRAAERFVRKQTG